MSERPLPVSGPDGAGEPRGPSRRRVLGYVAALPVAAALEGTPDVVERVTRAAEAARRARQRGQAFEPAFFTPHEWRTVRILVDLLIPADERSGSATEAGVPEFMDFMMGDRPSDQDWMRGGLTWLDGESVRRFGSTFAEADDAGHREILDDIAWPDRAPAALDAGVRFLNRFRDLTASGFWSSEMGVADLEYIGNTFVAEWTGCPEPALRKLGVRYEDWERGP